MGRLAMTKMRVEIKSFKGVSVQFSLEFNFHQVFHTLIVHLGPISLHFPFGRIQSPSTHSFPPFYSSFTFLILPSSYPRPQSFFFSVLMKRRNGKKLSKHYCGALSGPFVEGYRSKAFVLRHLETSACQTPITKSSFFQYPLLPSYHSSQVLFASYTILQQCIFIITMVQYLTAVRKSTNTLCIPILWYIRSSLVEAVFRVGTSQRTPPNPRFPRQSRSVENS